MEDLLQFLPQLLAADPCETDFGGGALELQGVWVAEFVKDSGWLIGRGCLASDLLEERLSLELGDLPLLRAGEGVEDVELFGFAADFEFDPLREVVGAGRIPLPDDKFDHVAAPENLIGDHRHEDGADLLSAETTSSLFTRSTAGRIFSTKSFTNRRNSSCSLRLSSTPTTSPPSSTPMYRTPPWLFRKAVSIRSSAHRRLLSLMGRGKLRSSM